MDAATKSGTDYIRSRLTQEQEYILYQPPVPSSLIEEINKKLERIDQKLEQQAVQDSSGSTKEK